MDISYNRDIFEKPANQRKFWNDFLIIKLKFTMDPTLLF